MVESSGHHLLFSGSQNPCVFSTWKFYPLPYVQVLSKRNFEFYDVNKTLTERYMNSAIPQMQRMLNIYQKKKVETIKQLSMPVNPDLF